MDVFLWPQIKLGPFGRFFSSSFSSFFFFFFQFSGCFYLFCSMLLGRFIFSAVKCSFISSAMLSWWIESKYQRWMERPLNRFAFRIDIIWMDQNASARVINAYEIHQLDVMRAVSRWGRSQQDIYGTSIH